MNTGCTISGAWLEPTRLGARNCLLCVHIAEVAEGVRRQNPRASGFVNDARARRMQTCICRHYCTASSRNGAARGCATVAAVGKVLVWQFEELAGGWELVPAMGMAINATPHFPISDVCPVANLSVCNGPFVGNLPWLRRNIGRNNAHTVNTTRLQFGLGPPNRDQLLILVGPRPRLFRMLDVLGAQMLGWAPTSTRQVVPAGG